MKKSLLALAALTAFAGVASAQSSVTLFGIVDLSARNVKNGNAGDISSLSTNGMGSSRLGFRGVEDLGGGLKAGFWLEGDISADVGGGPATATGSAANAMNWQRRSTVSLMGGFGELRLGRDYTPTFSSHSAFDPFGFNGVGNSGNIFSSAGAGVTTLVRANNSIGYILPAMGGLYGHLMVAAGEGATGNKYTGGRLGYSAGPVNIAGAWGQTDKTGAMADDHTEWNVGASYNMGFMTLMGLYAKADLAAFTNTHYLLGVTVPVGKGTIKASYGSTEFATATTSPKATQIAVGYLYSLSKRTTLYTHFSQIDNDAGLARTASGSGPAGMTTTGQKSTGYEFGINHTF